MSDASFDRFVDALDGVTDGLVLGDGAWVVSRELERRGVRLTPVAGDWPSVQLLGRFDVVVVEPTVEPDLVAAVHCAVQHLAPGGRVLRAPGPDHSHLDL